MFAALVIEQKDEPMQWAEIPAALWGWTQIVGILAGIALTIWLINYFCQRRGVDDMPKNVGFNFFGALLHAAAQYRGKEQRATGVRSLLFLTFLVLAIVLVAFALLTLVGRGVNIQFLGQMAPGGATQPAAGGSATQPTAGDWALRFAGLFAVLAVATPVILDLIFKMRWRRIWALSRLSLKEAIRSKVVLVFAMIALVFLVADWFVPYKPEDQLRNYVAVIYMSLPPLFLVTMSLLGSFSIPADIRSQSIHTVVTKPVEPFEIVLGRFLGYAILMTVGLAIVTALSLIYVLRGVHPDAQRESFKARVPLYGKLSFEGGQGESVGRVWSYRKYIGGRNIREPSSKEQFAVWSFDDLPGELGQRRDLVRFEFTFDIYRMTKGQENRGVFCNFLFIDGRHDRDNMTARLERFKVDRRAYNDLVTKRRQEGASPKAILEEVEKHIQATGGEQGARAVQWAQEYRKAVGEPALDDPKALNDEVQNLAVLVHGIYEALTREVKDYHTLVIDVPPQLFYFLSKMEALEPRVASSTGAAPPPIFRVWVNVDSSEQTRNTNAPQMVGMAWPDLYILADEKPFWQNFVKGIVGLWFTFLLVLGIAVPCSTYLSGVITWLGTMFLFFAGMVRDFVEKLARGQNEGGGPMVSVYRIFTNTFHSGQLDDSPTVTTLQQVDTGYQFFFRLILNILPDIRRFDLQDYVANGFDIAWGRMLLLHCFLPLVGYLIPWFILGYYLIKYREIANPQ